MEAPYLAETVFSEKHFLKTLNGGKITIGKGYTKSSLSKKVYIYLFLRSVNKL